MCSIDAVPANTAINKQHLKDADSTQLQLLSTTRKEFTDENQTETSTKEGNRYVNISVCSNEQVKRDLCAKFAQVQGTRLIAVL